MLVPVRCSLILLDVHSPKFESDLNKQREASDIEASLKTLVRVMMIASTGRAPRF